MCGISGIAYPDFTHPVDRDILRKMSRILRHRGPDGEGFYDGPGVGLGLQRLSIIDPETGDQPIFNEDKTVCVICNGEIYNYRELRKQLIEKGHRFQTYSDIEVIVHLYEDHGIECLKYLRGMFGLAICDFTSKVCFLARDRIGIKPLYYSLTDDKIILFGSEIKSILASGLIAKQPNEKAIRELFLFQRIHVPRTYFEGISSLEPGHYLTYRSGSISKHKYWDFPFGQTNPEDLNRSEQDWARLLEEKFIESVKIHMRSDVPLSSWLSAGVDSSAVTAIMNQFSEKPVHSFSLAFENKRYDEVRFQKTLDEYPGYEMPNQLAWVKNSSFEMYPKVLWNQEYPCIGTLGIPRDIISEINAKEFKVTLAGEGSDEVFGGYPWYLTNRILHPFSILPEPIRRLLISPLLLTKKQRGLCRMLLAPRKMDLIRYAHFNGFIDPVLQLDFLEEHIMAHTESCLEDARNLTRFPAFNEWKPFEQLQYIDLKTRLENPILLNVDRQSMGHSLEVRVPFLDHELIELVCRIPTSLKLKWKQEKYILRKAMENHLPPEICWRKKRGLSSPTNQWLKMKLPEFAAEMLSEDVIRKRGFFKPAGVKKILDLNNSGRYTLTSYLMGIISTQLIEEVF